MRFTVRRPANAEVSPCCHRPSGGDVACSVHVGVARPCVAGFALENRLTLAVPGRDVPTCGASLRRLRGRNLLDPTKSFVLQTRSEQTPSASADATVQPAFLCHPHTGLLWRSPSRAGHNAHVKCFDADRVEAPSDVSGVLLDPVLASVGLARFQLCDPALRASSPVGAALGAGEALLQHLDPLDSPGVRLGACSSSPVDRAADTATPRSIPTMVPSPGPAMGSGTWAKAMNQRPARSRVTR